MRLRCGDLPEKTRRQWTDCSGVKREVVEVNYALSPWTDARIVGLEVQYVEGGIQNEVALPFTWNVSSFALITWPIVSQRLESKVWTSTF